MNRRIQDPKEFFQLSPDGKTATLYLNDTALVGKIVRLLAFLDNGSKTQGAYEARAAVTCGIRGAVNNELLRADPRLKRREEPLSADRKLKRAKTREMIRAFEKANDAAWEASMRPPDNLLAFPSRPRRS